MDRKSLYLRLYNELLDNGLIDKSNFSDEYTCKREFIKIITTVFNDYYLLDQLHELN